MQELTKTIYKSDDGQIEFEDIESCSVYENVIKNQDAIIKEINEWFAEYESGAWSYHATGLEYSIKGNVLPAEFLIHLVNVHDGIHGSTPDEDFDVSFNGWNLLMAELSKNYNIKFDVPYYYWGK